MPPKRLLYALFYSILLWGVSACNLAVQPPLAPSPIPAVAVTVAWAEGGNLFVWQTGNAFARQVASGGVIRAWVSPNGEYVAFTRGSAGVQSTLWAIESVGVGEVELIGAGKATDFTVDKHFIGDVAWYDERVLYVNTVAQAVPSFIPRDDLYRVNVRTREVARLLPAGQGGAFVFSPNNAHIALIRRGTYARQDGFIGVIDPLAQQRVKALLYYVGVASGSERPFYPPVFWSADSETVFALVPDKDLIYSDTQATLPPTALWQVPLSNPSSRSVVQSFEASFFGLPLADKDGETLAFLRRQPASNLFTLWLAPRGGTPFQHSENWLAGLQSSPEAGVFVLSAGVGAFYRAQAGIPPTRLGDESTIGMVWAGTAGYADIAQLPDSRFAIRYFAPNASPVVVHTASTLPLLSMSR